MFLGCLTGGSVSVKRSHNLIDFYYIGVVLVNSLRTGELYLVTP